MENNGMSVETKMMLPVTKNLGHSRVRFQTKSGLYFHPRSCSVIVLMKKMPESKKLKPGPKRKLSDSARKTKKQRMPS
jgi:hypothetical protein